MDKHRLEREIFPYIHLQGIARMLLPQNKERVLEIRLRAGRPVMFLSPQSEWFLSIGGAIQANSKDAYCMTADELYRTLQRMAQHSLYAYANEIVNGYITLPGGHRVGIVGKTSIEEQKIKNITEISGLNIRVSHEVRGCGEPLIQYLFLHGELQNTLIVSPPACGKTTLLRDLARLLSNGMEHLGLPGRKVGIVDERSEICSLYQGTPQFDVGLRTDVLEGCSKHEGIHLLLRSMSPEVIMTDEIGNGQDMLAIRKALHAGVRILASFHGEGISNTRMRWELRKILQQQLFDRILVLSLANGPGTLEEVYDVHNQSSLFKRSVCG